MITPRTERVNWSTGLMAFEKQIPSKLKTERNYSANIPHAQNAEKKAAIHLTFYTLTSVYKFSILFSTHFQSANKEKLFSNQQLLQLVIISFILTTLTCDSRVIL